MSWRVAKSLDTLLAEVNARWPNRDKGSDGTIGDQSHQSRKSDHNPNSAGVVCARDIDDDLHGLEADPFTFAEHLRLLGKNGDPRLNSGGLRGYVIYFARIAGASDAKWEWRTYEGPNAHKSHLHVSVVQDASHYDSTASWRISEIGAPAPVPQPEEDEEMPIIIWRNGTQAFMCVGNKATALDGDEAKKLEKNAQPYAAKSMPDSVFDALYEVA